MHESFVTLAFTDNIIERTLTVCILPRQIINEIIYNLKLILTVNSKSRYCLEPIMRSRQNHRTILQFLSLISATAIILFTTPEVTAQKIEVIKSQQLYKLIERCETGDELCIYNFWATWCAPCVRELPHFEIISRDDLRVSVNLISLDAVEDLDARVKPFIEKRSIKSKIWLLDETDFNAIIPKVNNQWSGAIPATIIVDSKGEQYFFEKEFKEGELEKTINSILSINN